MVGYFTVVLQIDTRIRYFKKYPCSLILWERNETRLNCKTTERELKIKMCEGMSHARTTNVY